LALALQQNMGDGGVDLVQFDLMKSEVFMLAAYLKVPRFHRSSIWTDFGDEKQMKHN
jgi:hypothetical protein